MSDGTATASHTAPVSTGKRVVMVNGIPASGKSSIARALSQASGWPVLSVDGIKEPFMQQFGQLDRPLNRRLGIASYQAIWSVIAAAPQGCTFIVDAWFGFQPKESLVAFLQQANVTSLAEIWCQLPGELAAERYASRLADRLPGHPGAEYIPELVALAERAEPMQLSPVYVADQTKPVSNESIIAWTREVLTTVNYN
ncbi:AAA family ATPase [Erwinia sp.]|uniref:AAA family ATPase n=1 Tax=Erwinia citreus TaxID=558 RepID=UPI003C7609F8